MAEKKKRKKLRTVNGRTYYKVSAEKTEEKLREAIMSGAGDQRDKYLKELEEYSTGKRKKKPR